MRKQRSSKDTPSRESHVCLSNISLHGEFGFGSGTETIYWQQQFGVTDSSEWDPSA